MFTFLLLQNNITPCLVQYFPPKHASFKENSFLKRAHEYKVRQGKANSFFLSSRKQNDAFDFNLECHFCSRLMDQYLRSDAISRKNTQKKCWNMVNRLIHTLNRTNLQMYGTRLLRVLQRGNNKASLHGCYTMPKKTF